MRASQVAVLAALALLGCDARPVVNVAVVPASVDVPGLSTFARVTLAIDRCDVDARVPPVVHVLDVQSGSRPELELDIPPDVPLSFWIAAWRPCAAASCLAPAGAPTGVCLCDQGTPPAPQAVAFEGCSGFTPFAAGTESNVSLSLSATNARALCPTPRAACP